MRGSVMAYKSSGCAVVNTEERPGGAVIVRNALAPDRLARVQAAFGRLAGPVRHCLSLTCAVRSLTFHRLSLAFHCPSTAFP